MTPPEFAATDGALSVPRGSILAPRPEAMTRAALGRYPAAELSALARALGVAHSGNRAALVERILGAVQLRGYLATATVGRPCETVFFWLDQHDERGGYQ